MYLHEMEAGKPKPALPEDVAKLEAWAKSNPSLRHPSKPPVNPASPAGIPTVRMFRVSSGEFDFDVYYDCREIQIPDELFSECREHIIKSRTLGMITPRFEPLLACTCGEQ